ncbi:MAG: hypothetical protein K9W43_07425 [Candidatus Thorarchaeota archaeon]|nr:hypothetical protein [Candidatus Thorarchaeota archaeon]
MSVGRSVGRHRRALLKLQTALLVIAVLSPLWVMPLSAPVVSDVVVVMHHDSAVRTAVRTIVANDPHVQVMEYGSLEYVLTIHRTIGRVVWVSHGSEEGILAQSHELSWKAFSGRVQMTPGKDIVLACNSAQVNKYISASDAIGFIGIVDASLGGLLAVYLLERTPIVLGVIMSRVAALLSGIITPTLLAPFNIVVSIGWTLHGSLSITANVFDLLLYAILAVVADATASLPTFWDLVGVMLDCFEISFGNVVLDWLWPVLIKPFLQVLLTVALGGLGTVAISAATSLSKLMMKLYFLSFISSLLLRLLSLIAIPFLQMFQLDGNLIYSMLTGIVQEKLTGPFARQIAVRFGPSIFNADVMKAIAKIGVGTLTAILVAFLEPVFDFISYTYAPQLTTHSMIYF